MEDLQRQIDFVLDGFFYFFGFTENPADKKVKDIVEQTPGDKIKGDLRRINTDYRKKYLKLRKEVLCLD